MNVASLELCKELVELSGWGVEDEIERQWSRNGAGEWQVSLALPHVFKGQIPAYNAGYLLRKLPMMFDGYHFDLSTSRGEWHTAYFTNDYTPERPGWKYDVEAGTPEDALCKLAIELIKKGVIKL